MNPYQSRLLLLVLVGLFGASGASCPQFLQQYSTKPPRVLPPSPTLEQVIAVVNGNNSRIQSFSANNATLSVSGFPGLRTNVAFQRPKRFRLRAEMGVTGAAEVDVGSNDELFWFWMRRAQPPALYYCRHDEIATSQARLVIPIQPDWLIEAMGVAELDPSLPHEGPKALPNDRLGIATIYNTPEGPLTKYAIIDGARGWILEQRIYDARRQLLAHSIASQHRQDPLSGLFMPTVVQMSFPVAKLSMRIDLGNVQINQPQGNPAELWMIPRYPNTPLVNLADPNSMPLQPAPPSTVPAQVQLPTSNWRQPTR